MSNNITLYHCEGTPNSVKITLTLEELGLKYTTQRVDITKNEQKEPWFLEINPNGRVPALKDGDLRIFESGAIMLYLTDKYDDENKISYSHGTDEYYEILSWLMFQMGGIGPMQGQENHFRYAATARSDYAIDRYFAETKRLYSVLETRLSSHPWLAGEKYTIADIATFSWVRIAEFIELSLDGFPAVQKWAEKIKEREACKKGITLSAGVKTWEEMLQWFAAGRKRIDDMQNSDKH